MNESGKYDIIHDKGTFDVVFMNKDLNADAVNISASDTSSRLANHYSDPMIPRTLSPAGTRRTMSPNTTAMNASRD